MKKRKLGVAAHAWAEDGIRGPETKQQRTREGIPFLSPDNFFIS